MINKEDIEFMRRAMTLAQYGEGAVNPNPLVGALVVRNGCVIAQGYHARYGDLHAERNAFRDADCRGIDCSDATMYVTLEPCCHHGHQPPCTDAIIAHDIARVVVGLLDPNPLVAGKGLQLLNNAGILVEVVDVNSDLANELRWQNRVFLHYITTNKPWIVAKYAMSLDGKICTRTGDSQWITCHASLQRVHQLRKTATAILCGIGTVLADDPILSTRIANEPNARNPKRIVLDHNLRIPLESQLVRTAHSIPVIVVHSPNANPQRCLELQQYGVQTWCCSSLSEMLTMAGESKIDCILIEGGGTVNESFMSEHLINEVYAFIAPKLIGGQAAKTPIEGIGFKDLSDAIQLSIREAEIIGDDVLIHATNLTCHS